MAETNVSSVWNGSGNLFFYTGEPGASSAATKIGGFNATGNGMDVQVARTAAAGANAANVAVVCNFSFRVTDNTGTIYYVPCATAAW